VRRLCSDLAQDGLWKGNSGAICQSTNFFHKLGAESFHGWKETHGVAAQAIPWLPSDAFDPHQVFLHECPGLLTVLAAHLIGSPRNFY
jgi:hypothetical protein